MIKRKPPNEHHQMLPHYEGEYKPKQKNIDFEYEKEVLLQVIKKRLRKEDLRGYIMQ